MERIHSYNISLNCGASDAVQYLVANAFDEAHGVLVCFRMQPLIGNFGHLSFQVAVARQRILEL